MQAQEQLKLFLAFFEALLNKDEFKEVRDSCTCGGSVAIVGEFLTALARKCQIDPVELLEFTFNENRNAQKGRGTYKLPHVFRYNGLTQRFEHGEFASPFGPWASPWDCLSSQEIKRAFVDYIGRDR